MFIRILRDIQQEFTPVEITKSTFIKKLNNGNEEETL